MIEFKPKYGFPVCDWYKWFAWYPVDTVDRGWRWLSTVNKRRIHKHDYLDGGPDFWNQYAVTLGGEDNVVDIEANIPHIVQAVVCENCSKKWTAVAPVETGIKDYECPNCGPGFVSEVKEGLEDD